MVCTCELPDCALSPLLTPSFKVALDAHITNQLRTGEGQSANATLHPFFCVWRVYDRSSDLSLRSPAVLPRIYTVCLRAWLAHRESNTPTHLDDIPASGDHLRLQATHPIVAP